MALKPKNQLPNLGDIFNKSQHVSTSGPALSQIRVAFKNMRFRNFEEQFKKCIYLLLQSKHTEYFKTSCDFLCKFLKTLSEASEDRPIATCVEIAVKHFEVDDEVCRRNAVYLMAKLLAQVDTVDEEIQSTLVEALCERLRDIEPMVRAQAVYASRTFQDKKLIKKSFEFYFYRDPEMAVRKALLYVMDTKVFGHSFLVDSTQDTHDPLRIAAFLKLGKLNPKNLSDDPEERKRLTHRVLHNGLTDRVPRVSYAFRTHTLTSWLSCFYDGLDLKQLLGQFDVLNHHNDMKTLLEKIFERNLEEKQDNGTSTQLHKVVYKFREQWLTQVTKVNKSSAFGLRLPNVYEIDEQIIIAWLTLINFTRKHQAVIKEVKVRVNDHNTSIENLIEMLEDRDETFGLFELLTPDLVNLLDFLKEFIDHASLVFEKDSRKAPKLEFIYNELIDFILTYQIGDQAEREKVQEVLVSILRDNVLIAKFKLFIPPIIKTLYNLVYKSSSDRMINYVAELITNVRSDLEDLCAPDACTSILNPAIEVPQAFAPLSVDIPTVFKGHPNELITCLQMYYGCLQNVKIASVPPTMLNHLEYLASSSVCWFKENVEIICLATACNGVTALMDKNFALEPGTMLLLMKGLYAVHPEVVITSLKCIVDVIIQHPDITCPEKVTSFLRDNLRNYGGTNKKGESEFIATLVLCTSKLFYHERISDPELLADLLIWWYHPDTPSWVTQHIGIFLPMFIKDLSAKARSTTGDQTQAWLQDLLEDTFLISIEALHSYILGPGSEMMALSDINSLISFLCKLIPEPFHPGIQSKVEDRIAELLDDNRSDLAKYLKLSKAHLN